jgi:hypothetical protein
VRRLDFLGQRIESGVDEAGRDAVHQGAVRGEFLRQGSGEGDHAALTCPDFPDH